MNERTDLTELRRGIDGTDDAIVALFCERMKLCQAVASYKEAHRLPTLDEGREAEVLEKVRRKADEAGGFGDEAQILFRCIMMLSKERQERLRAQASDVEARDAKNDGKDEMLEKTGEKNI